MSCPPAPDGAIRESNIIKNKENVFLSLLRINVTQRHKDCVKGAFKYDLMPGRKFSKSVRITI